MWKENEKKSLPSLKKKHMAKWEHLMVQKLAGGLGFTNTRVMNKCLLAKWIFKIERGDSNSLI